MTLCFGAAACSDRATGTDRPAATPKTPAGPAVPVGVATAEQRSVPVQVTAVGNVQAHPTEGREVKRGDLLFTIDPRPFETALQQAQANVARDTAQLRQMEAAVGQRQAEIVQAQANLERDQAQWEMAR